MSVGNLMSNVRNIQCLGSRKVQGKAQSRDESDSSFVNVQSPFFFGAALGRTIICRDLQSSASLV
jgi:hypothetical protein